MTTFVDLSGLGRLVERLKRLEHLDATPLMANWMRLIEQDNREGVLAGLDKDGNPMTPVKYRPKKKAVKIGSNAAERYRLGQARNKKKGAFAGFGAGHGVGLHNNLTTREYQQLDGPPLAPRRQFSRVITNLHTDFHPDAEGRVWTAYGAWFEIVSTKGAKFLPRHFKGGGGVPKRNLCGVRPAGKEKARKALIAWVSGEIRMTGGRSQSVA